MRVAHRLATLIAVLVAVLLPLGGSGLPGAGNSSLSADMFHAHPRRERESHRVHRREWLTPPEMQALIRRETNDTVHTVDCCPAVMEMVEPEGGTNNQGMYVELFKGGENRQRFYELSCGEGVENKPCRFVDKHLRAQSRCVQKYSYSYALVRDKGGEHESRHHHQRQFPSLPQGGWMLDYIKVRSGCACELSPKSKSHSVSKRKHHDDATFNESLHHN